MACNLNVDSLTRIIVYNLIPFKSDADETITIKSVIGEDVEFLRIWKKFVRTAIWTTSSECDNWRHWGGYDSWPELTALGLAERLNAALQGDDE